MSQEELKEHLIHELYQGTCSEEQLTQLFDILAKEESGIPPEGMSDVLLRLKKVRVETATSNRIRSKVIRAISKQNNFSSKPKKGVGIRKVAIRMAGMAAAILIIGISAWLAGSAYGHSDDIYSTDYGEIREFYLPDGSRVSLNGNSVLRVSSWEEGEDRVVELDGEAYFSVEKKPATGAKFCVITPDVTIEVLGTSFNVNTRRSETRVYLEEGKVKVKIDDLMDNAVELIPGQIVRYSTKNKKLTPPKSIENELEVSWKAGIMEFRSTSLQDILTRIAAAHHLDFVIVDDSLRDREFNLALPTSNMDATMEILSKTTGTIINKENGQFVLRIDQKEKEEE